MTTTGSAREVFFAFLKLGLTSFGGPVAHLGYFRSELIERRRWMSDASYADLIALCQFLPGPASSQVGFALGLQRAGLAGGLLAWLAFTLPSALLLIGFASITELFSGALGQSAIHGLKLTAVAVVAHAVWGMAGSLCPDRKRAGIALLALAITALASSALSLIGAILIGAVLGLQLCRDVPRPQTPPLELGFSQRIGLLCLGVFGGLLVGLPLAASVVPHHAVQLLDAVYRAGALVFGGGHVVLPLLQTSVVEPGWVSTDAFMAGYGAAQAIPGPLFTFAAYLGFVDAGFGGAVLALLGIFLPGILILLAALPLWNRLRALPGAYALMAGANAAVVGILAATLYHPVWTSAVQRPQDLVIAVTGFVLLGAFKWPAWAVVLACLAGSVASPLLV